MQILKTRKKFVQGPRDFVQNQKISPIQTPKISPITKDEPPLNEHANVPNTLPSVKNSVAFKDMALEHRSES